MKASEYYELLVEKNIPLADIICLMKDCFSIPYEKLLYSDEEIDSSLALSYLDKLLSGYPVAYLTKGVTVRNIRIKTDENVLIPRTETIEFIFDRIKNNFDFNNKKVLDLCTGSGLIALSIKKLFKSADITASDISEEALKIAEENSENNGLPIRFVKSDFLRDIDETFDVILCNPPYVKSDDESVDAPFEPALALFAGADGLDAYRQIFPELRKHLNKNGMAFFEIEATNTKPTLDLIDKLISEEKKIHVWQDMNLRDRYIEIYFED